MTNRKNIGYVIMIFLLVNIISYIIYNIFINGNELKNLQVKCYIEKGVPFVKDKTNFFCAKDFVFIKKMGEIKKDVR